MNSPAPADPGFRQRVHDSFARQGVMHTLGATLEVADPGRVVIVMAHKPELTQQIGYFHAGIMSTIADNAGGYAALTLTSAGKEVLTVEYKINFLVPGKGEALIARGQVLKAGRTLIVCRSDVFNVNQGEESLAATAIVTLMPIDQ